MARRGKPLITIDPKAFAQLKVDADVFDKSIIRNLRKQIKLIAADGIDKVRARLEEPTPGGNTDGSGRGEIADQTKTVVSFAGRGAGARITARATGLPGEHKGLLAVYNMKQFRHPVFGHPDVWVTQEGRPYFGAVLGAPELQAIDVERIRSALDEATTAIGARGL